MIVWSDEHQREYAVMASEMLQYAGFQDGVNRKMRAVVEIGGAPEHTTSRSLDDLYRYYGDRSVFEDEE